jgi:hypothetical protein
MKKLFILSFLLYSLSSFSQTMTLINNTSEVIKVEELWINEFCTYNFPGTQPQNNTASTANQWIGPFSATTVYNCGSILGWDVGYDFEYVKIGVYDPTGPMTSPILTQFIGTDPATMYNPMSCEPVVPPFTTPLPPCCSMCVCLPPLNPGIYQVILPNSTPPSIAPSFWTGGLLGGKIYRMTWLTVYNTSTDKYDVEITIN